MTDTLIEKIHSVSNPTAVGLDTSFDYLPEETKKHCSTLYDAARAITEFNAELIERLYKLVPAVKVQAAYYESYGVDGMKAFADTLKLARDKGLIVIADVKRNDIGSTAAAYARAYLTGTEVNGRKVTPFESDYITVNGYLGVDGVKPFADNGSKGIFILVKTSNPSSGQLQDRKFDDGRTLYETVGALVEVWGEPTRGKYGYSDVGAVVGATHPAEAERLRVEMPHTMFLVPGYGAQGGTADGLSVCFDSRGRGAIVNNSRGILCAYKADKYKGMSFAAAAEAAVVDMREDIAGALKRAGKA